MLEPIRVADGDDQVAGPELLGVAEGREHQIRRTDPDDREIGTGIVADQIPLQLTTIRERDAKVHATPGNVTVGQDETVGGEHEARASPVRYWAPTGLSSALAM